MLRLANSLARGIPTGYLGTLEQRLMETENALSYVLRQLEYSGVDTLSSLAVFECLNTAAGPETNINKTARMAEWKRFPLRSKNALQEWHTNFSKKAVTDPCE